MKDCIMRAAATQVAVVLLLSCQSFGQTSFGSIKTLNAAHARSVPAIEGLADELRTIAETHVISIDPAEARICISGSPSQLELAEWLFHQLDQDPAMRPSAGGQYTAPRAGDRVRVFFLENIRNPEIESLVGSMYVIADMNRTKIAANKEVREITVRGPVSDCLG
jgi:phosphoenolpyruvate-protein kinase (PTS system EI component)